MSILFSVARTESASDSRLYDIFSDIEGVSYFIPPDIFNQKDRYDDILNKLFNVIIDAGITSFLMASRYDASLNATNYLKKDKNYYAILTDHWYTISTKIKNIFEEIK